VLKSSIKSLNNNTYDEPLIEIKDSNEINIIIPNDGKEDIDKLHCLIDIYFSEEKKISILIDSLIISTYFDFYIYDYTKQGFVNDKMDIYIPSFENECEIELYFLVSIFIKEKINGLFNILDISEGVTIIESLNNIPIKKYHNYFSIKLKFDLYKFYNNKIAEFEFKINNFSKKIILYQKSQKISEVNIKLIKEIINNELREIKDIKNIRKDSLLISLFA
jgi:hypothetical protein